MGGINTPATKLTAFFTNATDLITALPFGSVQMGTIAFPGSSNVQACEDPVAIVTSSAHLHISLANNVEAEVVVLIDRANTEFYDNKFFLFADAAGTTYLQWQPELPEGHEVLGRVMVSCVE